MAYDQAALFIQYLWQDPAHFIAWALVVIFSICIHEYVHAYAAWTQGDDTAMWLGYGTLNPLKLMGAQSLLMLAFIGIAWGAVPVNHRKMRHPWSPALVAASGPLSNLTLALLFGLAYVVAMKLLPGAAVPAASALLGNGLKANCLLFVFNMLPVPMLDGWDVYALAVPSMRNMAADKAHRVGWIVILILFLTPLGDVIWRFSDRLAYGIAYGIDVLTPFLDAFGGM